MTSKIKDVFADIKSIILTVTAIASMISAAFAIVTTHSVQEASEKHARQMVKRIEMGSHVRELLVHIMKTLDADKVSILEYHNGIANFTSRPFLYADVKYATYKTPSASQGIFELSNIPLDALPFADENILKKEWFGTPQDTRDYALCSLLMKEGIGYISFATIWSKEGLPIGAVAVTWKAEPKNKSILTTCNGEHALISYLFTQ